MGKIPNFCPVKGLTGLREELSTTMNVWINSEHYELRCALIYGDGSALANLLQIAKNIKDIHYKAKELRLFNSVVRIIRNVN